MTTIKSTCPACGEVELTVEQIRLVVCSLADLSYYAFDCTNCILEVRKPADKNIVSLLISGGVTATRWRIPAEALEEKIGPRITYDDLLDFALQLSRIDHVRRLPGHARRLDSPKRYGVRVIVGIICAVAIALALICLVSFVSGLLRRIKALDAQLARSRTQVAALNELLAQAPGRPS